MIVQRDFESMTRILQMEVSQAAKVSIAILSPSNKSKSCWTQELTDMRKICHPLHRKALKSQYTEDFVLKLPQ